VYRGAYFPFRRAGDLFMYGRSSARPATDRRKHVYIGESRSVFRSEGERAAWLLLCAWTHWLRDDSIRVIGCLFYACEAIGVEPSRFP
jgi:hypothetical protein